MIGLEGFERRIGFPLPMALKQFFARSPRLQYFESPSVDRAISFADLFPQMPHRFLPLLRSRSGGSFGLYFPRGEAGPFVSTFDHEESIMLPSSASIEAFFGDPDSFSPDHPSPKSEHPSEQWGRCQSLLIDSTTSGTPELELLKPLCLHYRMLEKSDETGLGRLLSRFGSTDDRARILQRAFPDILSILHHQRWLEVSGALSEHGFGREAVQALENSIPLLFIYPYYGNPRRPGPDRTWTTVRGAYESMLPLLEEHGDAFDRLAAQHQLEVARRWAERE